MRGDGKKGVRLLLGDDLYEIPVGIAHQGAAVVVGGVVWRLDRGNPGGVELLVGLVDVVSPQQQRHSRAAGRGLNPVNLPGRLDGAESEGPSAIRTCPIRYRETARPWPLCVPVTLGRPPVQPCVQGAQDLGRSWSPISCAGCYSAVRYWPVSDWPVMNGGQAIEGSAACASPWRYSACRQRRWQHR